MKKILFLVLNILCAINIQAHDSVSTDSVVTSHSIPDKGFSNKTSNIINKQEADSAYINNDFLSAIQLYEMILKDQGESADIYYNLGNSYYKVDNIAKAILNYERALLLNPGNDDLKFNLEMARSKTVDKVVPTSEMFFITWFNSLINSMSSNAWAKCGIISFIIFIIALLFYIFSKQVILKKICFWGSALFFIFTIVSNIFASQQKEKLINREKAIIMSPSVTVKSTPNESGTDLFILHEGRKVTITDSSMKDWKEIKLEDGNIGWIPTNTIEII